MKSFFLTLTTLAMSAAISFAAPRIDEEVFGKSLGGWRKGGNTVDYPHSGSTYRTYKPEISPTPDGGIFVSLRIDNVRGWFANNDHAILEISVNSKGNITSAQSNVAIQGRSINSDVIRGGTTAGQKLGGVDHAVQIGTDLVADLSSKLLQENIVEAGRVSFPSVVRHNYNLLFQAIRTDEAKPEVAPAAPSAAPSADKPVEDKPSAPAPNKVDVMPYNAAPKIDLQGQPAAAQPEKKP